MSFRTTLTPLLALAAGCQLALLAGCTTADLQGPTTVAGRPTTASPAVPGGRSVGQPLPPAASQLPAVPAIALPTSPAILLPSSPAIALPGTPGARVVQDLPDEATGLQVHLVYVLPADDPDRQLDTTGAMSATVLAANEWLTRQLAGHRLRLDTYQGRPDITFFHSTQPERAFGTTSSSVLDEVRRELVAAGFTNPTKNYAIFYTDQAGTRTDPQVVGKASGCFNVTFLAPGDEAGVSKRKYTFMHENFHSLGMVPDVAPHHGDDGHVVDDPDDLMAASGSDDQAYVVDTGHDDYYLTGRTDGSDLSTNPFFDPVPAHAVPPNNRPLALAPGEGAVSCMNSAISPTGNEALEATLVEQLEQARVAKGLPRLRVSTELRGATRAWMAAEGPLAWDLAQAQAGFNGTALGVHGSTYGSEAQALAEFLQDKGALAALAATDATSLAVAVVQAHGQLAVAVSTASGPQLVLDAQTLGLGPLDTYTLASTFHVIAGQGQQSAHARLDGTWCVAPFVLQDAAPTTVYVSVPRKGKHHVALGLPSSTPSDSEFDALAFTVDGDAPQASAVAVASSQ